MVREKTSAPRIHHRFASCTAALTCSKFIWASSVQIATMPMTAIMTVRGLKRWTLAGSACAVGVRVTRASRSSWRSVPRRPMASRVERGSTTAWSMGAMEATCAVVSAREAEAIASSTPATEAVSARVWARSMRRESSLEMVSPSSQSRSQTRPETSTTVEVASMARCASPAAWARRTCSLRSSRRPEVGVTSPRGRAPTMWSLTMSMDSPDSAIPVRPGTRTLARRADRVMRAVCSAAERTDMSRLLGARPRIRIRSHRVDTNPATCRSASRTVTSRRMPLVSHTA